MKLLLDQNLSYKLVAKLGSGFPDSTQARLLGMAQASDTAIWQYAADNGFTIVTKDSDFYERSLSTASHPRSSGCSAATPPPNSWPGCLLPIRWRLRPSSKMRKAPASNSIR